MSDERTEAAAVETDGTAEAPAETAATTETPAETTAATETPAETAAAVDKPVTETSGARTAKISPDTAAKDTAPAHEAETEASIPTDASTVDETNILVDANRSSVDHALEGDSSDSDHDGGSSDTTTDKRRDRMMSIDDFDKHLQALEEQESLESLESVGSYILQKKLSLGPDFFDILGEIPDLEEISLDVSEESVEDKKIIILEEESSAVKTDVGHFVDPLTGENIESTTTEEEQPPEEEVQEEEEDEDYEDDELLVPDMDEDMDLEPKLVDEDEVFETFMEMEAPKQVLIEEPIDFEALAREEEARLIQSATEGFLDELIAYTVDTCEYVDPKVILRQNLDKTKLILELKEKFIQLDVEQKARFFLNRKTAEYFRRKKAFRPILEDNPETLTQDIEKYKNAKIHLDRALGKEEEMRLVVNCKTENIEAELFDSEEQCKHEIHKFEELVRKTLHRESFEKIKVIADQQLSTMAALRNEISELRLTLIERQHTYAALVEKLEKLENLGSGLRMRDFEHLQTEAQALGKKIEERNTELGKLRSRCNADLHIMAHMKEKQQMLRNTIVIQQMALEDLVNEKQSCREYLFELKMDRGKIRKEIEELSFQGGLLDKPALMQDYDETTDKLEKLRARVDQLKTKYADIQQKLQLVQKRQERSL